MVSQGASLSVDKATINYSCCWKCPAGTAVIICSNTAPAPACSCYMHQTPNTPQAPTTTQLPHPSPLPLTCCSQCCLVSKAHCDILGLSRLMAEARHLQRLLHHGRVVCARQVGAGSNTNLTSGKQAVCRDRYHKQTFASSYVKKVFPVGTKPLHWKSKCSQPALQ